MGSIARSAAGRAAVVLALAALAFACRKQEGAAPAARKPTARAPRAVAQVPDPQAVNIANLAVAVRINRLDQLLPKIEAMVSQVVPITPDQIKQSLGGPLGDPALANVDQTRSVVLCVLDPPDAAQPGFLAVLPVTSDIYRTRFKAQGMLVYPDQQGAKTLLVTQSEQAMVAGRQAFKQLEGLTGQPMKADLSVYVNVERVMSRRGDQLEKSAAQLAERIKQVQQAAGQPTAATSMLALEMRGLIALAREIKDLEITVGVSKEGLDLGAIVRARPGTSLAKVLDGQAPPDPALLGYVPGKGAVVGLVGADTQKVADFLVPKIDEVLAAATGDAVASKIDRDKLRSFIDKQIRLGRASAFDMMVPGAQGIINGVIVAETTDPKAYEQSLRDMQKAMAEAGILDMYKAMGMEMKIEFTEKAREYNGVAIHKFVQSMAMPAMPQMPPPASAIMESLMRQEYEVALVGNYVVYDNGTKSIDAIIDALKAKKPLSKTVLAAQGTMPKNGLIYADIHPGRLTQWAIGVAEQMMGQMLEAMVPGGDQIIAKLKAVETKAICAYVGAAGGKFQGKLTLPVEPIVTIKNAILTAQEPVAP